MEVAAPVSAAPLACSVRGCGLALVLDARTARCARGHSFDRARSGYWNLLQPQDRRSLAAGDTKEAVEARARLFARGVGRALIEELSHRAAALALSPTDVVLELGSGSGDILAAVAHATSAQALGLDLSPFAAEHAARRFPAATWVVANADRRLPLLDHSIALALSIHGRRNPSEVARVLAPGAHALYAFPAADDLAELRAALLGESPPADRSASLLAELTPHFEILAHGTVRTRHTLDHDSLLDLLRSTYRGQRHATQAKVESLTHLEVTFASDWFLARRL
jgi:23S rRNA (guanine745-N1)-methyltransferase